MKIERKEKAISYFKENNGGIFIKKVFEEAIDVALIQHTEDLISQLEDWNNDKGLNLFECIEQGAKDERN